MASGTVNLNGGFYLTSDADEVTIRGFKIVPQGGTEFAGIYAFGVTGGKAEHNTVTTGPSFEVGIYYEGSTGCRIKGNTVSGTNFGIYLKNSSGNTIDGNTSTGVVDSAGIGLEEDSDNNTITANVCTNNVEGIVTNAFFGATLDGNVIKGNTCSGNLGAGIDLIHANNTTVSDNTANNNTHWGILVRENSNNNIVKRNRATGNATCDIASHPSNTGNVFSRNIADCTSGF